MTCRGFRQLFDAYLDGELSESQTAELHAHLLQCPMCQREVELMRAGGDVIALDARGPRLSADFADRVVAALPLTQAASSAARPMHRIRRWAEWGLMSAAAAVALGVIWFQRPGTAPQLAGDQSPVAKPRVAGETVTITDILGGPEVDGMLAAGRDSLSQWGGVAAQMTDTVDNNLRGLARQAAARPASGAAAAEGDDSADFVNELMRPFFELLNPPVVAPAVDDDVERF